MTTSRRDFLKAGLATFLASLIPISVAQKALEGHDVVINMKSIEHDDSIYLPDTKFIGSMSIDGGKSIELKSMVLRVEYGDGGKRIQYLGEKGQGIAGEGRYVS